MNKFGIMNKVFAFLIGVFILSGCEPDTSDSPEPQDVFVKLFGSDRLEEAVDFVESGDGGYVILGTSTSDRFREAVDREGQAVEDRDFYIVFADSLGNQVLGSERTYNVTGPAFTPDGGATQITPNLDQSGSSITKTSDGGYLVTGSASLLVEDGAGADFLITSGVLLKLDENGDVQWGPTLTIDSALNTDVSASLGEFDPISESINSVAETSDGNFVIIGTTNDVNINKPDFNPDTDESDIWVVKFPSTGYDRDNVIYRRRLGFPGADRGIAIFEQENTDLILIGNGPGKNDTEGNDDVLYVSSDANLFNNNFSEFSSGFADEVSEAILLADGGIALTGVNATSNQTILARINSGGSEVFFNTISEADDESPLNSDHRGVGLVEMNNGNIGVIGVQEDGVGDNNTTKANEILFFSTDGFGNLLTTEQGGFIRTYGGNQDDTGQRVMQLANGRFILLSTVDFENNSTMIGLMKTSASGNLVR